MSWPSQYQTIDERLELGDHEAVSIDMFAANADSFIHVYLTNPPCVEVDVELVYTATELGKKFDFEYREPRVDYTISAIRKICKDSGVTFAMLMEATHLEGSITITTKDQDDEVHDRRTPEEDDETLEQECEPWVETRIVENTTLHSEIRAWEEKHPGMMRLETRATQIKLYGVMIRTATDFAAMEQADRELEMEEDQHNIFQGVLLELKQTVADKAQNAHEAAAEY
jgi:hypothetical protein